MLTGTAVYGTVRTVVWEDGGETRLLPDYRERNKMKRIVALTFLACLLCSCGPLYYGFLPGTDYKMLKPEKEIDLKGKSYSVEFRDSRNEGS